MATRCPRACMARSASNLSCGVQSARQSAMPACPATRATDLDLSPDSNCTCNPAWVTARTAPAACARRSSARSNRASSTRPACPSSRTRNTCCASVLSSSTAPVCRDEPSSTRPAGKAPCKSCTQALNPRPTSSCTCVTCQRGAWPLALRAAAMTTARDTGCREWRASSAAKPKASCAGTPAAAWMALTTMPSRVKVPVLSKTTVSTSANASRPWRLRTSTPWRASVPAADNMATGVASDKAQGQVTINTDTATMSAWAGSVGHHHSAARKAASKTAIKKGRATRSATCANRGFCNDALSISATIWPKRVAGPVPCTSTSTDDCRL